MRKNEKTKNSKGSGGNAGIAALCLSIVLGMGGLAYASVPLYKLFCQVTGYAGTIQKVETADGIRLSDRSITVRFDANLSSGLDWQFKPMQREVSIKLGEQKKIAYFAKNNTPVAITGTATFNVTPQSAGAYFNKMECFCFTETTLQPGESLEMPVVFFVDPDIADEPETENIHSITLSYTFYQSEPTQKPLAKLGRKTPVISSQDKL